MNPRTLKKHREPVKDCPAPDTAELRGPLNACMYRDECCQRADELNQARADTKRLDWLSTQLQVEITRYSDLHTDADDWVITDDEMEEIGRADTLRGAIDGAMNSKRRRDSDF